MIGPDSNSLSGARSATNDDSAAYYYLLKKKNSSDFFNVKGAFLQKNALDRKTLSVKDE